MASPAFYWHAREIHLSISVILSKLVATDRKHGRFKAETKRKCEGSTSSPLVAEFLMR
jgi:hypothetical protein